MSTVRFKCHVCKVESVELQKRDVGSWRWHFPVCTACYAGTDGIQYLIDKKIRFRVSIGIWIGKHISYLTCYEKIGPHLASNVLCFYTCKHTKKFYLGKISPRQIDSIDKISVNRIPRGSTVGTVQYMDYIDVEDIHCLLLPVAQSS